MPDTKSMTAELLNELTTVSMPEVPKKKKRRKQPKKKLPQKKRESGKHNRTRKVKETTNLAHITKAIVSEGGTVPDIGVILGCAAIEGGDEWLAELKAQNLTIDEFMEAAKQRADIELIRVAVKAATGYSWVDVEEELELQEDGTFIVIKKKRKPRQQAADTALLKFLLMSRMPSYFADIKHIEINKRVVEIKADAEAEIRGFAHGLLKVFGEPVDAEFVERPNE